MTVPGASWRDRYRDPGIVARYFEERFSSPLGALLHARQAAIVREAMTAGCRRVLEVAAGPARFAPDLLASGARCVFLDRSLPMLRAARAAVGTMPAAAASWLGGDATALPFPDAAFDLVLAFRFLRHLDPAERARSFDELARVLRPGGQLLFDAVNEEVAAPLRRAEPDRYPLPDRLQTEAGIRGELADTSFVLRDLEPVQRRYLLQRRLQILLAPRSRRFAAWAIGVAERGGRAPLEWVVVCRRG